MPTTDSLPTTPVELTSALYTSGTLREGAIVNAAITDRIELISGFLKSNTLRARLLGFQVVFS